MTFPQPISDHIQGSAFVHSMMRAVDAMKSECPILGECGELDYPRLSLKVGLKGRQ